MADEAGSISANSTAMALACRRMGPRNSFAARAGVKSAIATKSPAIIWSAMRKSQLAAKIDLGQITQASRQRGDAGHGGGSLGWTVWLLAARREKLVRGYLLQKIC
jgi:hypothetical protein